MSKIVNANLDRLKLLLALMVVAMHCKVLGGNDSLPGYLLCNGLLRIAVPVFFLINGYFLGQALQGAAGIRRWLGRIVLLYVFWMLVYSPFYVAGSGVGAVLLALKQWLIGFFHLWYLLGMIGGGLLLYAVRERRTWQVAALALIAFALGLALQYARAYVQIPEAFLQHFNQNDYAARNFLFMGFPFVATGFLLARHQLPARLAPGLLWTWLVVALLLMLAESWFNYHHAPDRVINFDFMFTLPLVAPVVVLLALHYPRPGTGDRVGRLSAAVYFTHPLLMFAAMAAGLAYGSLMALLVALLTLAVAPLVIAASRRWRFIL